GDKPGPEPARIQYGIADSPPLRREQPVVVLPHQQAHFPSCRDQSAGWHLRERCLHGRQVALLQGGHDVLDAEGVHHDYSPADVSQWYFVPGSRCFVAAASNAVQP
ncbi:MAG: hypothetical protein ACK559_40730, partial [bacterium]